MVVNFRRYSSAYKFLLFGAIFVTADDFFILGGFLLVIHFFTLSTMCKKVAKRVSKQKTLRPQNEGTNYKTFQESTIKTTAPSETYFSSQYRGEFTSIVA